jgi:hypothetical protein
LGGSPFFFGSPEATSIARTRSRRSRHSLEMNDSDGRAIGAPSTLEIPCLPWNGLSTSSA